MKKVVISLGGSLIVPKEYDKKFLHQFKKTIRANYRQYKFIIVCGGGWIAREYIASLKSENKNHKEQSLAGIRATRMNAKFMMQFFGKEANDTLPKSMLEVSEASEKNNVVFCGALRYAPNETSDGTASKLAHYFKCDFINMTDVLGLYTKNPKEHKDAKFVKHENWKDFETRALKLPFKAGQHFVLDQQAAILIRKNKTRTYIIGKSCKNLNNLLNKKKFIGTTISE